MITRSRWTEIKRAWFPTAHSLLVRHSLKQLDLRGFNSVLVVGAGRDPYRQLFEAPNRYVALDIVGYEHRTNVIADAHVLPFASGSFDCVFASEVLEHLASPPVFSSEVLRVLVPGGQLILTVPYMFHTHADPNDYWRLTRDGLKNVLSSFSPVDIFAQGNRLHVMSDLVTTAFRRIPVFFPLRVMNHLIALSTGLGDSTSSAPSGFLVIAKKYGTEGGVCSPHPGY